MPISPKELLKKYVTRQQSASHKKADAALISDSRKKELTEASVLLAQTTEKSANLLAKTTQVSADLLASTTVKTADQLSKTDIASAVLLAKTTKTSAELLATTTEQSADRLRKSNDVSNNQMKWLTIAVISVGLVQIVLTVLIFLLSR